MLYSHCTALAGHWFPSKSSTVVGIVLAGSGIGGVVQPIMLQRLFERIGEPIEHLNN